MPTPSEQKALAFMAAVVLLGGAVRVVRAGSTPAPNPLEQQALARQATAAERKRLWKEVVRVYSGFEGYQQRTQREIPLLILERV
jgi:hypothetical protein